MKPKHVLVYFFDGKWRFSDSNSQLKGAFDTKEEAETAWHQHYDSLQQEK